MKIYAKITLQKDRGSSIKKQLQCNNKLFLHGVFKGSLKFSGLFKTRNRKAMHMHHPAS